jgi:hypothetical protein
MTLEDYVNVDREVEGRGIILESAMGFPPDATPEKYKLPCR